MAEVEITQNPDGSYTIQKTEKQAEQAAAQIPGWASWDEQQALDWIDTNVNDLASAKTALKAMARLVVHLRDAQWPGLAD